MPESAAFYSTVQQKNVLGDTEAEIEKNYSNILRVWNEKGMTKFSDWLQYYNNLDTETFHRALKNMQNAFYENFKIDIYQVNSKHRRSKYYFLIFIIAL